MQTKEERKLRVITLVKIIKETTEVDLDHISNVLDEIYEDSLYEFVEKQKKLRALDRKILDLLHSVTPKLTTKELDQLEYLNKKIIELETD